jgi:uncharacterized protein YndB with AHSA1/START domain
MERRSPTISETEANCPPVTVSRRIDAPAEKLFALLTDPAVHPQLDGSGLLTEALGPEPITAVGDVFVMAMHNDEMGDYEMTNHVVTFEPIHRIVWEPALSKASREEDVPHVGTRLGHQWGWELDREGPSATMVTEFFDCAQAPTWLQQATENGTQWIEAMRTSLERLAELATAGHTG